jgi:hypothetical protein
MKKSAILIVLLLITSCGRWDNPFIPKADPEVVNVVAQNPTLGVSISQKFKNANDINIPEYSFVEPTVTIANRLGLPRVIFKQMVIEFTVNGNKLPPKVVPIAITVPTGGVFSGPISVLSASDDILKAVYPNNSFTNSITSGFVDVTLVGKDDNDNIIALKFTTPVRFLSDPSGFRLPTANQNNQNTQNNQNNNNNNNQNINNINNL